MTTLREVLDAAAAGAPAARIATTDTGATSWSVRDIVFAELSSDGGSASFRLDPIVAAAAARTPDVRRSTRGPGWIELTPRIVDAHVADRAGAWFLSGHRRLTGPGA